MKKLGKYRKCLVCDKEFYVKPSAVRKGWGKYCSKSCADQGSVKATTYLCLYCNQPMEIIPSRIKKGGGKFCSYTCRSAYYKGMSFFSVEGLKKVVNSHKGHKHWNWKGGRSKEMYGAGWTKKLKDSIRLRDNNRCQCCGFRQNKLKEKLTVHHKNEIKTDLNPNNLISLCRKCHMKIHVKNINKEKPCQKKK